MENLTWLSLAIALRNIATAEPCRHIRRIYRRQMRIASSHLTTS